MPYSFTQIEKDKSRTIAAAFCFLIFLYFMGVWVIVLLFKNYFFIEAHMVDDVSAGPPRFKFLTLGENLITIAAALSMAALHWLATIHDLVNRLIRLLKAEDPRPDDPLAQMFRNIVEEVCVATGGSQIRGMIIPTMALNACAFSDGDSVPVIAVTKGLLEKLNRNQLEAVVAHEAAHVVSGDSESTTIISSMFEIFSAILRGFKQIIQGFFAVLDDDGDRHGSFSVGRGGRSGGGGDSKGGVQIVAFLVFMAILVVVLAFINFSAMLMRMFVSRQREYRADAIAARLTRYPLALAEALYIIAHYRHSLYDVADSLETLFIVNPAMSALDEDEGLFPNLFSTHPPIQKRIRILLSMGHGEEHQLQQTLQALTAKDEEDRQARAKMIGEARGGLWYVQTPKGDWSGPHNLPSLTFMEWLTPQTRVKKMGENTEMTVSQIEGYMKEYQQLAKVDITRVCPACAGQLEEVPYEYMKILKCRQCGGHLLNEDSIGVILYRKEKTFDERIQGMAQTLLNERRPSGNEHLFHVESDRMHRCERCKDDPKKMRRCSFNRFYPVEVDKCMACGLTWFDKDELEVMQCLYELRDAGERGRAAKN